MRRRKFLKNTASGLVLPTIAGGVGFKSLEMTNFAQALQLANDTDKVIVMVYLSGGNDGLNTVVPLDQLSNLSKARENVLIPENQLLKLNDADVGLHPSMTELKEMYDEGKLTVVQNVGYPDPDFSHFRSTDIWMSGSSSDQIISSGWTGRYLEDAHPNYPADYPNTDSPHPLAIEIGYSSSMLFQGASNNMGMVINDPEYFYELIEETNPPVPNTKAGNRLEYVRLVAKQSQVYGELVKQAAENVPSQGNYPDDNWLAEQLKIVARLIAGGLQTKLYLVEYGSFDTHDGQVDASDHTKGEHANLLKNVSSAIKAFSDDLEGLQVDDRVIGMTFSEFGRRVLSNASGGTDHGTSAPLFLFGSNVNSGVIGANAVIPDSVDYWYNMDMQFDFRQVYSTLFAQWLCVPQSSVDNLLYQNFEHLPFVKNSPCGFVDTKEHVVHGQQLIKVFPNPVMDFAQIEFIGFGTTVQIEIYTMDGKKVSSPLRGNYPPGNHVAGFSVADLPAGTYFVKYRSGTSIQSAKLIKM